MATLPSKLIASYGRATTHVGCHGGLPRVRSPTSPTPPPLPPSLRPPPSLTHYYSAIAIKYGITVAALAKGNGLADASKLTPGHVLIIPKNAKAEATAAAAAAAAAKDASVEPESTLHGVHLPTLLLQLNARARALQPVDMANIWSGKYHLSHDQHLDSLETKAGVANETVIKARRDEIAKCEADLSKECKWSLNEACVNLYGMPCIPKVATTTTAGPVEWVVPETTTSAPETTPDDATGGEGGATGGGASTSGSASASGSGSGSSVVLGPEWDSTAASSVASGSGSAASAAASTAASKAASTAASSEASGSGSAASAAASTTASKAASKAASTAASSKASGSGSAAPRFQALRNSAQAQCSEKSIRCMQVIIGMTDSAEDAVRHVATRKAYACGAGLHEGTDLSRTTFNGVDQCCSEDFEVSANQRVIRMTGGLVSEGTPVSITCKRRSLSMDGLSIGGKMKQVSRKITGAVTGYEKTCSCEMSMTDTVKTGARQILGAFTSLFK